MTFSYLENLQQDLINTPQIFHNEHLGERFSQDLVIAMIPSNDMFMVPAPCLTKGRGMGSIKSGHLVRCPRQEDIHTESSCESYFAAAMKFGIDVLYYEGWHFHHEKHICEDNELTTTCVSQHGSTD